MRSARSAIAASVVVALCAPIGARASEGSDAAARAARYLAGRQQADGSFATGSPPADGVAETAASLLAGGVSGTPVARALSYVREHGPARAKERAGLAGRIALALVTAGEDPARFGFDYIAQIESSYDPVTGTYDTGTRYANALAALGLLAAGRSLPAQALTSMRATRCPDGGFPAQTCVQGSDTDTTALMLNVFSLAKQARDVDALAFLRSMQNDDGGFGHDKPHPRTNANSTGLALSALAAIGDPPDPRAAGALMKLQLRSGAILYRAGDARANDYAAVQAIPGLLGMGYPLRASRGGSPHVPAGREPLVVAETSRRASPRTSPSLPGPCTTTKRAARAHLAGLVVMFAEGRTRSACVSFTEPSITGFQLLERSGIPVTYKDYGGGNVFVCAIDGFGRDFPRESCEPPCPPSGACAFWGYYTRRGGEWLFSDTGAGTRAVRDGDTDGWRWGVHASQACPPDPDRPACDAAVAPSVAAHRQEPIGGPIGVGVFAVSMVGLGGWAVRIARARRREEQAG